MTANTTIVAPIVFITDVHALGLQVTQGLQFFTAFYWDRDDASRAWSRRFFERRKAMPTMTQAGVYSAVLHYLRSVEAARDTGGTSVMAQMRRLPVDDFFAPGGIVRADGQMVHDMYLVQVKKPGESKASWDYYRVVETVPGDRVFQTLEESECPLVRH